MSDRRLHPHELSYPTLSPDTDPEAERVQFEILRNMPPWRKMQLVFDAIETSQALLRSGLRQRHPEAGPQELKRRFFGLWLGEDLAAEVYGPLEDWIARDE